MFKIEKIKSIVIRKIVILQNLYQYFISAIVLSCLAGYSIFLPYNIISAQRNLALVQSINSYNEELPVILDKITENKKQVLQKLPEAEQKPVSRVTYVTATAYSSTVDQCDSTPCITANGFNVCEHNQEDIIATNALPFGTKVRFPELYGDRIFTVMDRMNARYTTRVDFWKKDRQSANTFGIKHNVKMEIL